MAIDPFSGRYIYDFVDVEIDEKTLTTIAQETGGKYFRATDNLELQNIYDEINKLEKTEITETIFTNVSEKYRSFVLIGLILFIIEILARKSIFKSFI